MQGPVYFYWPIILIKRFSELHNTHTHVYCVCRQVLAGTFTTHNTHNTQLFNNRLQRQIQKCEVQKKLSSISSFRYFVVFCTFLNVTLSSFWQLLILDHAKTEKNLKRSEKVYKVFFEKSFHFTEVLDIPVIKGQLALNIPKRASHNSF